jgi:putative cell wall-binding protein
VLRRALVVLALVTAAAVVGPPVAVQAATSTSEVHPIVFPVIGEVHYTDTFGAPRSGGRAHEGEDLLGQKMQQLVAADSGTIRHLVWPEASYGNYLQIVADDGYVYSYVHINNDTPGTDDGKAARDDVYGPGIDNGVHVERGQLVAYMGDSGNAETTQPHLHFEMHRPDGSLMNPMASLDAASHLDAPAGQTAAAASPIPRLAGSDRVGTAIAVSTKGWPDGAPDVVLASGSSYAEALPASVLAGMHKGPLLLVTTDRLPGAVGDELTRLGAKTVTVVGSVATTVADDLRARGVTVHRVGVRDDPVATAAAGAHEIGGASGIAVLVNRDRFADGVSASALAAGHGWPILLTSTSSVPQVTVDAWRAIGVHRVVLVGGTGVIGQNVEDFVRSGGGCETGAPGSPCEEERLAGTDRYGTSVATTARAVGLGDRTFASSLLDTGTAFPDALSTGPLAARLGGVALLVDGSGARHDAATRALLHEHASEVQSPVIVGGSAAVTSAADRAIQEALGIG